MIEELKMNKLHIGVLFGIFALVSFVGLNLYTSTSYIGYGNNEACNNCHNQPALVKTVNGNFGMTNWAQAEKVFSNGQWATDEVPTVQTNNRSNTQFDQITFLKNTTDIMVRAQVASPSYTTKGSGTATSDKFAMLFDINSPNITVGDFLTYYNSTTGVSLDNVLTGNMAFTNGAKADLWYVVVSDIGVNATGKAQDMAITTGVLSDGSAHQDVYVSIWYGDLGHGSIGYRYYFVRPLDTGDSNDAQFNVDGTAIHYAIADWQGDSTYYHMASFDQTIIVGDSLNVIQTSTVVSTSVSTTTEVQNNTVTVTQPGSGSSTAASFTTLFVLAGLVVAIPVISTLRRKKE